MDFRKVKTTEALLWFCSYFLNQGYEVFLPLNEDTSIDLIIYLAGVCKRIQVKATKPKDSRLKAQNRSCNNWSIKKYTTNDIDFVAVYDYENKQGYLVPETLIEEQSSISLRLEPAKNKQEANIKYAKDFKLG